MKQIYKTKLVVLIALGLISAFVVQAAERNRTQPLIALLLWNSTQIKTPFFFETDYRKVANFKKLLNDSGCCYDLKFREVQNGPEYPLRYADPGVPKTCACTRKITVSPKPGRNKSGSPHVTQVVYFDNQAKLRAFTDKIQSQ